jgi:ABC-type transport system substrate-binding protein
MRGHWEEGVMKRKRSGQPGKLYISHKNPRDRRTHLSPFFCLLFLYLFASTAQPAPVPRLGGELRQAIFQPVKTLDPANYLNFSELQVASNLYEGLVRRDSFGRVVAAIAQSWTHSDDYRVWNFTLSPKARFHNGNPVTASDVKSAWERIVRGDNWVLLENPLLRIQGAQAYLRGTAEEITGIQPLSDDQLQATLETGDADFLTRLTSPAAYITIPGDTHPIGAGRFQIADYTATEIRLTANLDYVWGGPYLDNLTFRYYTESREALLDFESGLLDVLPLSFPEAEKRRREAFNQSLIQTGAATLVYLRVNPPVWSHPIRYAIDINALLKLQYGGVPPTTTALLSRPIYDPVRARRRVNHVELHNSRALHLIYAPLPDNTGGVIAARIAHDYLSPIGLQITTKPLQGGISESPNTIWLLSTPAPPGGDLAALTVNSANWLLPLYTLSSSFLGQPTIRGVQTGWGGVLLFDNAWLTE